MRWAGPSTGVCPKPTSSQVSLLPTANSFPITKEMSSEEHLPLEGHTWLHPLSSCHGPGLVLSPPASFSGAQLRMTLSGPQYQACQAAHFSSPCSPVSLRKCVLLGHMALPAQTGCLPGPGTALLSQARPGWGGEGGTELVLSAFHTGFQAKLIPTKRSTAEQKTTGHGILEQRLPQTPAGPDPGTRTGPVVQQY